MSAKIQDKKRLDSWLQKQRDSHVSVPWNCAKEMHEPHFYNSDWKCKSCDIFLSNSKRQVSSNINVGLINIDVGWIKQISIIEMEN